MSVSRRLRYEILRRDNFACTYCGATAPEAKLTVDHVVPVALGGTDVPQNLTTACVDCNSGKSATPPDAPVVESVNEVNRQWAQAIRQAANDMEAHREALEEVFQDLLDLWRAHMGHHHDLPDNWRTSIEQILSTRLPLGQIEEAIEIMGREYRRDPWRYFVGICWRKVDQMRDIAAALVESEQET